MKGGTLRLAALLAARELRAGPRGFGVFLACLFLGTLAVSSVGSFSEAARAGIRADARALLGGDVEVRLPLRQLTREQLSFLENRGSLSAVVELRAMAFAGDGPGAAPTLVELKAVDPAYPLSGHLELAPPLDPGLALAPAGGEFGAVVDRSLLERLGVAVGEHLRLGEARYRVRAVLGSEPDRTIRAFHLGPRVLVAAASLPATGLVTPGSLANYAYRVRLPAEAPPERFTQELNEAFPDAGWRVRSFREAAPRVRQLLDRLGTHLTLVGLCSLLVGGLGVGQAVRAYLDTRLRHIASMKCVGAPARPLFAAYLGQILTLAGVGSGAGALLGAAAPGLASHWLADALPLRLLPALHPGPILTSVGLGLLVAVAFSALPLGAAVRVSPVLLFRGYAAGTATRGAGRGARLLVGGAALALLALATVAAADLRLTAWFLAGSLAAYGVFRALAALVLWALRGAPRLRHPALHLGLRSLARQGPRARASLVCLGLGLAALVTVSQVEGSLGRLVAEIVPESAPAFFFVDIQDAQLAPFEEALRGVTGLQRWERLPATRGRITRIGGVPVARARVAPEVSWAVRGDRYLTYAATPPPGTAVSSGQWWPADYRGAPLISLTSDLAAGFGVGVGDRLTVNVLGREIEAEIANLREVDWSTLALNFAIVFAPGALEGAPHTHLAAVYAEPQAEEPVFRAVTAAFPNVSAIRVREVLESAALVVRRLGGAFQVVAGVVLVTGFLVLAGAAAAEQHRRIYDAVVFKVCGATRRDVIRVLLAEAAVLGGAAGLVGALVGSAAAWGIVSGLMDTRFVLQPGSAALAVGGGVALSALVGGAGTARALGRPAAPLLRNE